MSNILVVENQQMQYKIIKLRLQEASFNVYPQDNEYKEFISWIHVYSNRRFTPIRRNKARDLLLSYLREKPIDLFIFDFKLSVNHDDRSGIFLASDLQTEFQRPNIPVIFLSQMPLNMIDEEKEGLGSIKRKSWVEKGYAGITLEERGYFEKNIIAKISLMLKDDEIDYEKIAKELMKSKRYECFVEKFEAILKHFDLNKFFSDEVKILLFKLYYGTNENGTPLTETQVDKLFQNFGL